MLMIVAVCTSIWVGRNVEPTAVVDLVAIDQAAAENSDDEIVPVNAVDDVDQPVGDLVLAAAEESVGSESSVIIQWISGEQTKYFHATLSRHFGVWSLLPAFVALALCWMTREPLVSLAGGALCGALSLGQYDLTEDVLVPIIGTPQASGILILYLWLLGGLLGVWSRTGAAEAFARWAARHFVRGPRSAKVVAWALGILFFQGGTISTVLVGTAVRPLADANRVSHEELSYIVDSTASPVASLIAFNAWPGYIQSLLLVPGVAYLATESARIQFFFQAIPLSFYSIFAIIGTFLVAIDRGPFIGSRFRAAVERSRQTGQLNRPGSMPMNASIDHVTAVPEGYRPHVAEFLLPLAILISIAVGTFVVSGKPEVRWAFGAALLSACGIALFRGLTIAQLMQGISDGLKGATYGSVVLMMAIVMGTLTSQLGGGRYLVDLLGNSLEPMAMPAVLFALTVAIAFSTGTSWGTYAVVYPLAMPLAVSVSAEADLSSPTLYVMVCFASVLNASTFGDQCSPISDTTVLTAMTTGADLMDHVLTQLVPAGFAAGLAVIAWTAVAGYCH
ncbi:Na+/H+ antiporter family protein [Stratiformator vulcanicus]|uniref:Na+/H+ antiporter family protein n=2 Tax=Stratiformator vulcanicus TaxID=2527980 RepID=A0A517QWY0_9PLAN|nr:Na+/H+ antiporter family protein [Stratiformator vulcanicus]